MTHGAAAAPDRRQTRLAWSDESGKQGRHPVAVLKEGMGHRRHCGVLGEGAHHLGPEPFGRVDPALVNGEINPAPGAGMFVDVLGLGQGGVVLPEEEHGRRLFGKFRLQGQRYSVPVHRAGG